MKIKVLGIAPYKGLGDLLTELAKEEQDIQFQLEVGDLRSGVAIAEQAVSQGIDIMMSRGGTASLIQKHVRIPVVDIPVSGYDLLRALTLIKDYQGKAAVVGFENITQGVRTISELFGIEVDLYTIKEEMEVWDLLRDIQEQGTQIVLGDVITDKAAKELGMQSMLITSGRESVKEAFHTAKQMYRLFKEASEEQRMFRDMIDQEEKGMLVIDDNSRIRFVNKMMKKWMEEGLLEPIAPAAAVNEWWEELAFAVQSIREGKLSGYFQLETGEVIWHMKGSLLSKGELLIAIEQSSSSRDDRNHPVWSFAAPVHSLHPFSSFTQQSSSMRDTVQQAQAFSQTHKPILLYGEEGTGKSDLALAIHQMSPRRQHTFMTIHCSKVKETSLLKALPAVQNGTIFLRHVEHLPLEVQHDLALQWMKPDQQIRWLASSSADLCEEMKAGRFDPDLYSCLQGLTLYVPSLSERVEDMEDMSRLFIAEFNSAYGTQVVGLAPEVMDAFRNRTFRENVRQFKRVLEELALTVKSGYITLAEAAPQLDRLSSEKKEESLKGYFEGTLEDIERRIIQAVLKEENMNQSKAAKRLNINRTTLWRKLKE
ncbi:PrpR N-terminal domain-containing protein [Bacillus sp. T17B1]|uniref:sigma-54-dependent Fis family transcriptional regulator n=1 Tax=Bacillus sp. T17B1 TaxID=2918911 RepID=UPI002280168F|nr:PrpR N-terminal domain-containing protein [Bacillus sp. T17B1]